MTEPDAPRSLPAVTPEDAHFWQGGGGGMLQVLRCQGCHFFIHPPSPICPKCRSRDIAIATVSGRGRVASFTVNHQAWRPGLRVPYLIAIVELNEQAALRLTTNIVNCAVAEVQVGLPVSVVFEQIEDVWLPLFEPDPDSGDRRGDGPISSAALPE
jgi:uncharacterized OB-fold protein